MSAHMSTRLLSKGFINLSNDTSVDPFARTLTLSTSSGNEDNILHAGCVKKNVMFYKILM